MQTKKIFISVNMLFVLNIAAPTHSTAQTPYKPTWNSLKNHSTPQWLKDGKFGIYTHWGIYAVPAQGPNATWYANKLYNKPEGPERKYHEATYGPLGKFGYKDFIQMFTGEKFNADEWAELFRKAGARFAGPVAEHHDGFAMWDTKYSEWNAAKMGPKRDILGELSRAIKKRDMKFVTAFHHAEAWFYFPTWDNRYDCGDPKYSGLYGPIHEKGALPTKAFLDTWKGKIFEVIDKYDADFIWFDFGLKLVTDSYKQDMLPYFYNHAIAKKKEVVVTYKSHDLPPGAGLLDWELGQEPDYATVLDWPGEKVLIKSLAPKGNTWAGLYPSEIASVTMLANSKELKWEITKDGMSIETPKTKPCEHAYVFRIMRRTPFI
jgi:alpha-L-fucosidase